MGKKGGKKREREVDEEENDPELDEELEAELAVLKAIQEERERQNKGEDENEGENEAEGGGKSTNNRQALLQCVESLGTHVMPFIESMNITEFELDALNENDDLEREVMIFYLSLFRLFLLLD